MWEKSRKWPVVLIVEDEGLIRMDVADFLTDEDMTAIGAESADQALEILASRYVCTT